MKNLALLSIVCLYVLPLRADEPRKPKFVHKPTVMSVMIGAPRRPSFEVTYDERELRYYSAKSFFELKAAKPIVIKPTDAQWEAFLDELDKLNVWTWNRDYPDPGMNDGTFWRAIVSYETRDTRDLVSRGFNVYPENFDEFSAALRKLIGEREFK